MFEERFSAKEADILNSMGKISSNLPSSFQRGLIFLTILCFLLLSCNFPEQIVKLFRNPSPTISQGPTRIPSSTTTPTSTHTSTPGVTPSPTPSNTPTPFTPTATPSSTSIPVTLTAGPDQIVSGQDIWTLTSIDFPPYISTIAKVIYPYVYKKPLSSYVFLRLNFDCTTGKSLLSLYTGNDMGLTFVHRPDGYPDVYLQDYLGSRDLITLMGSCWLAAPIPRTKVTDASFVLHFKELTPLPLNHPTTPIPKLGKIVFSAEIGYDAEIFTINEDGSEMTRLTEHLGSDHEPSWSPDEQQIAYVSQRDGINKIYKMDLSGGNVTELTNNPSGDGGPAWSPLGGTIAFHSFQDGNWEIYSMTTDGGNPRNLTRNSAADTYPSWSPDGSQIAFQSDRDGNWEVYIMNANGGNLRRLTYSLSEDRRPAWSPEGTHIAFWSMRDGAWHLYISDLDGNNLKPLTAYLNPGPDPSRPAWSPDGSRIVISLIRDNNLELYIVNADGTNPQRLTHDFFDEYDPNW